MMTPGQSKKHSFAGQIINQVCGFDFTVDIPARVYERGSGYTWTKLPGVVFTPADIFISRNDTE